MYNKKNGVYYTPLALAEFLAKPLINSKTQSVLDPSYGEGSLLLAAERIFTKKKISSDIHLFGCDTKPVNGLLKHLPEANLQEMDFFDYEVKNQFQTILMNPPYVRRHIQNSEKVNVYRKTFPNLSLANNSADLWALFLIKSVTHLKEGGNIGAILPWAFLQADYAKPIRNWLFDIFREIKVVALSDKFFEKADERVVVIWLNGYGHKCKSLKIGASESIKSKIVFSNLSYSNWCSDRVFYSGGNSIDEILSEYKNRFEFKKISNYAEVKIGVVTGSVDYFIMPRKEAKETGFNVSRLIPILKSSTEFGDYLTLGKKSLNVLIALKAKDHLKYTRFIRQGVKDEINLRAHSEQREPWYAVKVGKIPDAFFHYRATKIPFLLPNPHQVQSTNSIHRIYYKNITEIEKKWMIVSMLSTPSQLSVETNSKTYGRGILKIEPKSLKETLVITRNDPKINSVYEKIILLLGSNKKELAAQLATEFIYEELGVSEELKYSTEEALKKFRDLRITKN